MDAAKVFYHGQLIQLGYIKQGMMDSDFIYEKPAKRKILIPSSEIIL